jgi:alginate O-acetyltransferase complex protein AlgJ
MHAAGAGLPDQLAFELGTPVDVLGVRGSGATPARVSLARRARANQEYLANKKVIVWCFGARELTQADDWKTVPLLKSQDPAQ